MKQKGYHSTPITKGILGKWSKVEEEIQEYLDAKKQEVKILMACELADCWGAYELYSKNLDETGKIAKEEENYFEMWIEYEAEKLNLTFQDLTKMADLTALAFKNGLR